MTGGKTSPKTWELRKSVARETISVYGIGEILLPLLSPPSAQFLSWTANSAIVTEKGV